jgi:hypothetical protein
MTADDSSSLRSQHRPVGELFEFVPGNEKRKKT